MLDDIELFIKLIDVGSFGRLALLLKTTQATISRRIKGLETQLRITLINRDQRNFKISEDGKLLYDLTKKSMDDVNLALNKVKEQLHNEMQGTLRLVLTTEIAKNILLRQLPFFLDKHPEAKLHISFTREKVNLARQRYDMAITSSIHESPAHQISLLANFHYKLFASPIYITKYGSPKDIADISNHRCIGTLSSVGEEQNNYPVRQIKTAVEEIVQYATNFYMDTVSQGVEVAKGGEYMTGAWDLIVKDELKHGDLIAILPEYDFMQQPCYLIRQTGVTSKLEQELAKFIEDAFKNP